MSTTETGRKKLKGGPPAHHRIGVAAPWSDVSSTHRRRLITYLGFSVLLVLAFFKPFYALTVHAGGSDLHSHILLVPFISIYLIGLNRKQLPRTLSTSLGFAAILLLGGCAALLGALQWQALEQRLSHNDYLALMTFSFICFLAGGGFLFLGRSWMKAATFPFAFLLFMIPLPDLAVDRLERASLLASAEAANLFFTIFGTPVLRDGVFFQLPGIMIEVAQSCSGIRSSWVLLVTSVLASHLFLASPWRRIILVAFVVPLAILRNGFRIFVIALLCIHLGPHMIDSFVHKRGGPIFFALSLIPLFLLLCWLRKRDVASWQPVDSSRHAKS